MKSAQKSPFKDKKIKNRQDTDYWKNKYIHLLRELVLLKEKQLNMQLKKKGERV